MRKLSLASRYVKAFNALNNYVGNSYGIDVRVPNYVLPAKATEKDVVKVEGELAKVQRKIKAQTAKQNANIKGPSQSPISTKRSRKITVRAGKAKDSKNTKEYKKLLRSYKRTRTTYKNNYGIELPEMPALKKHQAVWKKDIQNLEKNIKEIRAAAKQAVKEETLLIKNVKKKLKDNYWVGDSWSKWKSDTVFQMLDIALQVDKKGVIKRLKENEIDLEKLVENLITIAYNTTTEHVGGAATDDAWRVLLDVIGKIAQDTIDNAVAVDKVKDLTRDFKYNQTPFVGTNGSAFGDAFTDNPVKFKKIKIK